MTNFLIDPLSRHPFTGKLEPYSGAALSAYKLISGHFTPQQFNMTAVSPRPDSETGSYAGTVNARHRWAYYDGVNPVRYEWPVKVFGGAAPHIYELLHAPVGATIGNVRTAADHGIVKWTPTQSYPTSAPAVFVVRVYGNDKQSTEITWTVATSSSTNQFIFVNNVAGNDSTGTGSINAPFATLGKVTGSTIAQTTYPNRIVYLRGTGTDYLSVPHSDHPKKSASNGNNKYICHITAAYNPMAIVAFPDESVAIDLAGSEFKVNSSNFCFSGSSTSQLVLKGSATLAYETHNFWIEHCNNGSFNWITFDGFVPRNTYGTPTEWTNFSPIIAPYSAVSEAAVNRRYWSLHGVQEINRVTAITNDSLLHVLFGTSFVVTEYCSASRTTHVGNAGGVQFKDGNHNTSVRYCDYRVLSDSFEYGFTFSNQSSGSNNEIVFSKVRGAVWFNLQNSTGPVGAHYAGRCSIYCNDSNMTSGFNAAIRALAKSGAIYTVENCVLMSKNAPVYASGQSVSSTGNECHSINTSGNVPLDITTMLLKNSTTQFRATYLGTRGAEIQ